MESKHIVSAFDDDLNKLNKKIRNLGDLAISQFTKAIDGLATLDSKFLDAIISKDQELDDLEVEINDNAFELISLRSPVISDLRRVISAIKISSTLERVGDYAKNIAKRSKILLTQGNDSIPGVNIGRMGSLAENMLSEVLKAYLDEDAERAVKLRDRDLEIDYMYTAFYNEVLAAMTRNPSQVSSGAHLLFIAKNIERIGDHATGIAEQVYFQVHGKMLEDDRPKSDILTKTSEV